MVAKKVEIRTVGKSQQDVPVLVLKSFADGWSYEVQNLESGPLPLAWRAETMQLAEEKLKASYDPAVWDIRVVEHE